MARWTGPARDQSMPNDHRLQDRLLSDRLLVLAPHMDDETLACGGTVLRHNDRQSIYCLFATDGAASPAPLLPWRGRADPGIVDIRRQEALAATSRLGIPESNLRFLGLPDGGLAGLLDRLVSALEDAVHAIRPQFVLAPFRFDVHPDHIALNRAARGVLRELPSAPQLLEFFVYHRLRLAPQGDVRRAITPERLITVDTTPVADAKRAALDCYRSQTTILYPWQERPTLTPQSLEARCAEPEVFLHSDPAAALADGLAPHALRIRIASMLMRWGKRPKDRILALLHGHRGQ